MTRAEGNQSRAAQWLGLNRNTLRKKLIEHNLLK
jgi:Fis family transcriptional regulator